MYLGICTTRIEEQSYQYGCKCVTWINRSKSSDNIDKCVDVWAGDRDESCNNNLIVIIIGKDGRVREMDSSPLRLVNYRNRDLFMYDNTIGSPKFL